MKCGYCGKTLKDDAQFCSNCGHSTEDIHDEPFESQKSEKGTYAISIFLLIIVLALTVFGGYVIIHADLHQQKSVSGSDSVSQADMTDTDAALVGKWICTDPAAADYDKSNYGIEIKAWLTLTDDGTFALDYSMTDTGIQAMSISASGQYSTEDGIITFTPDKENGIADFLKKHGQHPAFQYATAEGSFTLKYENDSDIVFTRVAQ